QGAADLVDVLGTGGPAHPASLATEVRARLQAYAAGPVGRGHLLLAEGLDPAELDGVSAGADEDGVLGHLEHARRQGAALHHGDRADLDALALERAPRARSRGTGPDLPVDAHRRVGPLD